MAETEKETDKLIHQQSFTIRIHEINQEGILTIPALLRLLQEASMQHIITLKASVWDLSDEQISWVLLRKQLNILGHVEKGERITVLTYPTGFDKFFAFRDYLVFDENKKLIATAATMWSLIDTSTRKITKVPESLHHLEAPKDIKRLKRPEAKNHKKDSLKKIGSYTIKPYDLDWNAHVNNVVLCRHMMESLIIKGVKEADIKKASFQFKNESHLNDEVSINVNEDLNFTTITRDENLISSMFVEM